MRLLPHRYVASPPTSMLGALYANIEHHRRERSPATMPTPRLDKMVADLSNKADQHEVVKLKKCAAAHAARVTCPRAACGGESDDCATRHRRMSSLRSNWAHEVRRVLQKVGAGPEHEVERRKRCAHHSAMHARVRPWTSEMNRYEDHSTLMRRCARRRIAEVSDRYRQELLRCHEEDAPTSALFPGVLVRPPDELLIEVRALVAVALQLLEVRAVDHVVHYRRMRAVVAIAGV